MSASIQRATIAETWRSRENLLPGLALLALTAVAWSYTLYTIHRPGSMGDMADMSMTTGPALFLLGWASMMVAMMLPAALPLVLLYRTVARKQMAPARSWTGMAALLAGYAGVWTAAGLPVYGYNLASDQVGSLMSVLPGLLLIAGGVYQFTALKHSCHSRCSSPLFFVMQHYKSGSLSALRLGVLHGIDCIGCCVGLMLGLVALGMMNLTLMLTAAVVIFVEKTLPGGHRVAKPLGAVMIVGGVLLLAIALNATSGMA